MVAEVRIVDPFGRELTGWSIKDPSGAWEYAFGSPSSAYLGVMCEYVLIALNV